MKNYFLPTVRLWQFLNKPKVAFRFPSSVVNMVWAQPPFTSGERNMVAWTLPSWVGWRNLKTKPPSEKNVHWWAVKVWTAQGGPGKKVVKSAHRRRNNGPVIISHVFVQWAHQHDTRIEYIQPGKLSRIPISNGLIEQSDIAGWVNIYLKTWNKYMTM